MLSAQVCQIEGFYEWIQLDTPHYKYDLHKSLLFYPDWFIPVAYSISRIYNLLTDQWHLNWKHSLFFKQHKFNE